MLALPTVVSVPKNTKCLSGVDTNTCLDAVGAFGKRVALVLVDPAAAASHSKQAPLYISAINFVP